MAANKSVTVLAPNGRRQTVKVTPNTTILQVLEEVCKKQGYGSQKWDLKHHSQILEASSIIRFTGLPNNAQLEMVQRSRERETSNVTIGIQLENGKRLMGDFSPETSLIEIIRHLCPGEEADNTVVTYMHQEVHGSDNLSSTTLQTLGLNSGRAMLRLLHRDLNKLTTQAHVAGNLSSKPNKSNDKPQNKAQSALQQASNVASSVVSNVKNSVKKAFDPVATLKAEKAGQHKNSKGSGKRFVGGGNVLGHGEKPQPEPESSVEATEETFGSPETTATGQESTQVEEEIPLPPVEYLGERDALIFNQAEAKAIPRENLPDSFYDVTVDDAKALLRDAKRQREAFEESPLTTNAQREYERIQSQLNTLHKYLKTIIRIQFPGQMVLQGIFKPVETVQSVKDFVKSYLENPDQEFELYVTPPRKNLSPLNRLIDENLVPTAIIYYSGASDLKAEVKAKVVDPKIASAQASKSRMSTTRGKSEPAQKPIDNVEHDNAPQTHQEEQKPSGSGTTDTCRISTFRPKWFK